MAKIKYGIKNVHIAVRTEGDEGITYAAPIKLLFWTMEK